MRLTPPAASRDNSHMRTALKSAAVQLALVAMMLRALLPAGWMPSAPNRHAVGPIMLCPGMDRMAVPMPSKGEQQPAPQADHAKHTVCIFAAAAPLASPAADAAPMPAPATVDVAFIEARDTVLSSSISRAFAARAPPSLA